MILYNKYYFYQLDFICPRYMVLGIKKEREWKSFFTVSSLTTSLAKLSTK